MNKVPFDEIHKIQVLLIDDEPRGLPQHADWPAAQGGPPQMDVDFEQWFDFRWVATPEECREFRDLSWMIAQQQPELITCSGWLPELLIIDYALTQDTRSVAIRVGNDPTWFAKLSPLPSLRECFESLFKKSHSPGELCPVHAPAGSEYWGCFLGGLVMNTFADHPCSPVTITRYNPTTLRATSPDAAFFEWLMHVQSGGLLRADGKGGSPRWQDILPRGVAGLRTRIEVMAKAGVIHVSLDDLFLLAERKDHPVLTVDSRFGRRRYPVAGLFIDRQEDPSAWAQALLQKILPNVDDFKAGLDLAKAVWAGYRNVSCQKKRWRLSELLLKERAGVLEPHETVQLADLKSKAAFGYKRTEKTRSGKPVVTEEVTNPDCIADIRMWDLSKEARRWAILLVLHRLRASLERAHTLVHPGAQTYMRDISKQHAFHALFPLPSTPAVLPWDDSEKDAQSSWGGRLADFGVNLDRIDDSIERWESDVLRAYAIRFE